VNNAIRRKNEGKTKYKLQELEYFNSHRIIFFIHVSIHTHSKKQQTFFKNRSKSMVKIKAKI